MHTSIVVRDEAQSSLASNLLAMASPLIGTPREVALSHPQHNPKYSIGLIRPSCRAIRPSCRAPVPSGSGLAQAKDHGS